MLDLNNRIKEDAELVVNELDKLVCTCDADLTNIYDSMRYSLFAGGKRVRPFLVLEFCRLFGGDIEKALPFALAIECIHTYSLVHDDLPCMDDDNLRRGKPTNHVVYGEATAVLCGDALQSEAYNLMTMDTGLDNKYIVKAVKLLSQMSGATGMVGGQIIDLASENKEVSFDTLCKLHAKKTGCLIKCAALLGCYACGDLCSDEMIADATKYAEGIGLAFQIVDDILDKTGNEEVFGKPIGSDDEQNKTTFLSFMGVDKAYDYAKEITASAKQAIEKYDGSSILLDFADMLISREK